MRRYYLAGVDVNKLQVFGDAPDGVPALPGYPPSTYPTTTAHNIPGE